MRVAQAGKLAYVKPWQVRMPLGKFSLCCTVNISGNLLVSGQQ
jgi:hypothetical protein